VVAVGGDHLVELVRKVRHWRGLGLGTSGSAQSRQNISTATKGASSTSMRRARRGSRGCRRRPPRASGRRRKRQTSSFRPIGLPR
jgi:hypothetical protein